MECQELDEVLSTLIVETRKENGEKYPPLMLQQLLSDCIATLRYFIRTWTYVPQFSSSKFTFSRLLINAQGSLKNEQGNYTLLGCFIHYNIYYIVRCIVRNSQIFCLKMVPEMTPFFSLYISRILDHLAMLKF